MNECNVERMVAPPLVRWNPVAAVFCVLVLFGLSLQSARAAVPKFCTGCNFAGSSLAGADLSNAVYVGSNFANADLRRASLRGAKFVAANFAGADLRGAVLDGTDCTACNFEGAKLDRASFSEARMTVANFEGFTSSVAPAQLRALLAGCTVCNFHAARLAGRDLSGLRLVAIDFSSADLRDSTFDGAALCWYDTQGKGRVTKCDNMRGAQVRDTDFRSVQLCGKPLERRGCVRVGAHTLRQYTGSKLEGAILSKG
ncbi:MAG: pentapeptide repeat-containing protein [Candidatus Eremiobacteraeota bacterium]|nr:pentapeptide repeat-containing protein [Candidatus Eremiobacteraeota bacterium]